MKVNVLRLSQTISIKISNLTILLEADEFKKSVVDLLNQDEISRFLTAIFRSLGSEEEIKKIEQKYIDLFSKNINSYDVIHNFYDDDARKFSLDIFEVCAYENDAIDIEWKDLRTSRDQCFTFILRKDRNLLHKIFHIKTDILNTISFMRSDIKNITHDPFRHEIYLQIDKYRYLLANNNIKLVDVIEDALPIKQSKINVLNLVPQTYDEKLSSLDELFKRSADYKNSKNFKEALAFVIKIKNVAPFNAWLLRGQNPDITHVATANDWANRFNRALNPKARAYVVMNHTPVGFVYDIADTAGEELPIDLQSHFRAEGVLDEDMINNTIACCHKKNIVVEYDKTIALSLAGRASHSKFNDTKRITINAEHTKEVQFSTLCHEIAHLMLGHLGEFLDCQCKDRMHLSKEVEEIEAESVSWLVCDRLGIKTDAEKYLNGYLNNPNLLEDISINNILITAGRIESMALKKECNIKKVKS